ncbi:MAG: hypothetical protein AB1642_02695 [Pseudomonadota bacterium]
MALSPLRKWLNAAFGLVLLVLIGISLWSLLGRPFELRAFCTGLQPGISYSTLRDLAELRGFRVSPQSEGVAHVYDYQSLGKFTCTLRMHGDRLAESSFAFSD